MREAHLSSETVGGGHVDDRTALTSFNHRPGDRLGNQKRSTQINVEQPVLLRERHRQEVLLPGHTRVVDQDVDAVKRLLGAVDQPRDLLRLRDIARDALDPADVSEFLDCLRKLLLVAGAGDARALVEKRLDRRPADARLPPVISTPLSRKPRTSALLPPRHPSYQTSLLPLCIRPA
jgi:hypothetical protein